MARGWKAGRRFEQVVAGRSETLSSATSSMGSPLDEHDEIDRLRDQPARHGCHGLLDQLLNAVERRVRRVGMDCCYSAGVAGIPGFQHVEGFGSPHLANDNAVGTQAERR